MDNNEVVERDFEPKPGFALVKYGNVFTFNFNEEFCQRLKNILVEFHKSHGPLTEPILGFYKNIAYFMHLAGGNTDYEEATLYQIDKYEHVYSVLCEREFVQSLNQVFTNFLAQKRVSPAMFSFAKQLEGALYPKRFDSKTRYADEF